MHNNDIRYYRIGSLVWQITGPAFHESEELAQFRCEPCQADEQFFVRMADEIVAPAMPCIHKNVYEFFYGNGESRVRLIYQEQSNGILLKDEEKAHGMHEIDYDITSLKYYSGNLALRIMDMPHRIISHGGIFLHASYIIKDGQAILFTAPKQTGKSTQAELWRATRGAEIINGDRVILRKIDGTWYACSSPYCGTSKICQDAVAPIKAIVILGQSKKNAVCKATAREALEALLNGCTYNVWDKKQVDASMSIMERIITDLLMVRLDCLPDESAVAALEEFLWQWKKT